MLVPGEMRKRASYFLPNEENEEMGIEDKVT